MDTMVSITAYGPPDIANNALNAAFAAMNEADKLASFHRSDSEASILNRDRKIRPSPGFTMLLNAASEGVRLSGGFCDPTFAVLHKAYGFYDKRGLPQGKGRLPSAGELGECLSRIGWNKMVFEDAGFVALATGVLVDFEGIGGGFAVEEAIGAMRNASCTTFFIDNGGDLWMEGKKPEGVPKHSPGAPPGEGSPWKIGIRDPRNDGLLAFVESSEPLAVSTSGDYEKFLEVNGQKIGHIMDPFSGLPPRHYRSVTVLASSPLKAEILVKRLFCSAPGQALEFSDSNDIPALFLPASGPVWVTRAGKKWFSGISP